MGIDPTEGITGWHRDARVREDRRTNNGAIEIIRLGREYWDEKLNCRAYTPDVQVCEYAAPIDAFEIGFVANILGRLYGGKDEDQCLCIMEVFPGPGKMTMRQMVDNGYTNFYIHQYYAEIVPTESKSVGWTATQNSLRDLWLKVSRHINKKRVKMRSPWLVEEYADARMNLTKLYPISPNNESGHGDRRRAFDLALWAGNRWDAEVERTNEPISTVPEGFKDWQYTDMTPDQIREGWGEAMDRLDWN
jgi:hypothetical protein